MPGATSHPGLRFLWLFPPALADLACDLWTAFPAPCWFLRRCRSCHLPVPPLSSTAADAFGFHSGLQASGPPTSAGFVHASYAQLSSWAQWLSRLSLCCFIRSSSPQVLRFRLPATYSRWVYCLLLTPVLLCPAFLCMQAVDSLRDGTSLAVVPTVLSGQVMKYVRDTLAEFRSSFRSPRRSQLCYYARLAQIPSFPILARAPSHLPLLSSIRRSAHGSFAIFLYQTVPQHLQVHSVSRQQPRGAGLHNRPGASRPGRTRSFARTSIARFSPKAAGLPWSVGRSTPTLTPPHVPEGLAVSCARRMSSPPRGPS